MHASWQAWFQQYPLEADWSTDTLTPAMQQQLTQLYTLLIQANQQTNLTRITDPAAYWAQHIVDSLSVLKAVPCFDKAKPIKLLDIGSGAGFPAFALAITHPQWHISAVDSVGKKVAFIQHASQQLCLGNLNALHARCEDLAHQPQHREQYDVVTARAVSALNILCELCLPFVKPGGYFIALKTVTAVQQELPLAQAALKKLGGALQDTLTITHPLLSNRCLVVIEKAQATPSTYPRKAGTPQSKPL